MSQVSKKCVCSAVCYAGFERVLRFLFETVQMTAGIKFLQHSGLLSICGLLVEC